MSDAGSLLSRVDAVRLGVKRYFTGKPCKSGHISQRKVHNRHCAQCANEEAVATRPTEPVRVRERDAAWRRANPERLAANGKRYFDANIEKRHESQQRWRDANRAYIKAVYENNKDRWRIYQATRRALIKAAGGTHSTDQIDAMFVRQKGKCPWCKVSLKAGYHIDHHMPLARGGTNDISNIQLLCADCNRRKSHKHPIAFAQSRGFLL